MSKPTIILTGATGILGKLLVKEILKKKVHLILLVRATLQELAERRVRDTLHIPHTKNVTIISSDLTKENFGVNNTRDLSRLFEATHILHLAASTKFTLSLSESRRNNVETTKKLLKFAKKCKSLIRFGYVSTAYVAGKRTGPIYEDEFYHSKGFLNTYEQSKYEGEESVRQEIDSLPIVIFRPSIIITPYEKNSSRPVNAVALGLYLFRKGYLPLLPGSEHSMIDIIPGKVVAISILDIFLKPTLAHTTYHLTSGDMSLRIKDVLSLIDDNQRKKLPITFCGDMDSFKKELQKKVRYRPDLSLIYKKTESFLPELAYSKTFHNTHTKQETDFNPISFDVLKGLREIIS